jgi:hypothetical protein
MSTGCAPRHRCSLSPVTSVLSVVSLTAACWGVSSGNLPAQVPAPKAPVAGPAAGKEVRQTATASDAAVERTRRQVRMLDDLYKTAVVFITETYVHTETDVSAGTAAVKLFDAMRKKEWHDARLLDATNNPYDDNNVPRDEFEKEAVKLMAEGKKDYAERIETVEGVRYLRAVTPIPVVSQKCVMCHPHYADAKPGHAIGAISYRLKIE